MKFKTLEQLAEMAPQEIKDCLEQCKATPQSAKWHPEGDVYVHIRIVFNRAMKTGDINQILAALFHDLGKVAKTKLNKHGDWGAHGHENVSSRFVEKHKDWITELGGNWEEVYEIVNQHMRIKHINEMKPQKRKDLLSNKFIDKILAFTDFDDMTTLSKDEL